MAEALRCPKCGEELANGPEGLCPRCVVEVLTSADGEDDIWRDAAGDGSEESLEELRPGKRVRYFGDYEILSKIASGGMGVVFRARQITLNRIVALKMILGGECAGDGDVARFRCEAEAAANLDHPNIIPIYEIGRLRGRDYFTMKFIDGESLAKQSHRFAGELQPAARLMATVARAVHHGHQHGIIHRDLKPANILLDSGGVPFITDFGLAKRFQEDRGMTQSGALMGTPSYMAPEQAAGKKRLTTSVDIYGLGAILYELITGRPPFQAETKLATLQQVQANEPQRPRSINHRIDRDLETLCLKCLEKDPARRYGSAEALAKDLERWLRGEPIEARSSGAWQRTKKLVRRHPAISGLIVAVVLLAMAVAAISTTAAIRLVDRGRMLKAAEGDAREKLRGAYLAQAQARRFSGRAGRRFESLEALRKAVEIRPGLDLRNEAIACLALVDVKALRTFKQPTMMAFDSELERFATGDGEDNVQIRETLSGKPIKSLKGVAPGLFPGLFSPDGRFLAMYNTKRVMQVWDVNEGVRVWPGRANGSGAWGLENNAFSANSTLFVFGVGNKVLHSFDLHTGTETTIPLEGSHGFYRLTLDATGEKVAVAKDSTVTVHRMETGALLAVLPHPGNVEAIAWHPDGKHLATACLDFQVHYWDTEAVKELPGWSGHKAEVVGVMFDQSGRLLITASWDNTTRVWDSETRKELVRADSSGARLKYAKNGQRFVMQDWDGSGYDLWEVATGCEVPTLYGHHGPGKGPYTARFHRDSRIFATAGPDGVRIWDTAWARELQFFPMGVPPKKFPRSYVVFSTDGRSLFANGWQRSVEIGSGGDPSSVLIGKAQATSDVPNVYVSMADNHAAVIVDDGGAKVIALDDAIYQGAHPNVEIYQVAFPSPDGRWIATLRSGSLTLWDRKTASARRNLGGVDRIFPFSPDSKSLITKSEGGVRILDIDSWRYIHEFPKDQAGRISQDATWSPDGRILAIVYSPHVVQLTETTGWQEIASLQAPDPKLLNHVEFSPDGSRLAVCSEAHLVDVWDLDLIRRQLAGLSLDWDLPQYSVRREGDQKPLHATVAP